MRGARAAPGRGRPGMAGSAGGPPGRPQGRQPRRLRRPPVARAKPFPGPQAWSYGHRFVHIALCGGRRRKLPYRFGPAGAKGGRANPKTEWTAPPIRGTVASIAAPVPPLSGSHRGSSDTRSPLAGASAPSAPVHPDSVPVHTVGTDASPDASGAPAGRLSPSFRRRNVPLSQAPTVPQVTPRPRAISTPETPRRSQRWASLRRSSRADPKPRQRLRADRSLRPFLFPRGTTGYCSARSNHYLTIPRAESRWRMDFSPTGRTASASRREYRLSGRGEPEGL